MSANLSKKSITATAGLRQLSVLFRTGRCHITLSPVKHPPPAMRPFSKFFDHFIHLLYKFDGMSYSHVDFAGEQRSHAMFVGKFPSLCLLIQNNLNAFLFLFKLLSATHFTEICYFCLFVNHFKFSVLLSSLFT